MKKLILTIALALATFTAANAQFGIVGGYTMSNSKLNSEIFKPVNASAWHAGVAYKIELGPLFTLQPALVYQAKGSTIQSERLGSIQTNTGYVELEVGAQLGIDLLAFRPFILLEPFVGYGVYTGDKYGSDLNEYLNNAKNKFEFGFGVGGGVEIFDHVQLSVQWFMNVGKLYKEDALKTGTIMDVFSDYNFLKDVKNYQGLKVSVGIFF